MKRLWITTLLACSLLVGLASIAATASTGDTLPPEPHQVTIQGAMGWNLRVSGFTATGADHYPDVAYNSTKNQYLVVWQDGRNYATRGYDIYGQRISSSGAKLGGNFRISGNSATTDNRKPAVAYDSTNNRYLVVWQDSRNLGLGNKIYGQRISSFGARLGGNLRISGRVASGHEEDPAIAYNASSNQYLVVWSDGRNSSPRGYDIYGQRLSATGAKLSGNKRISGATAIKHDKFPAVAHNSTRNQYLVVWQDLRNSTTRGYDIFGQRLSATGAKLSGNKRISGTAATGDDVYPSVAHNSSANQYLVAWQDRRNPIARGYDIFGQRLSSTGAKLGNNRRISGTAAIKDDLTPDIAYNSSANHYFIVWNDDRNHSKRGEDIFGQRLSAFGALLGKNVRVSGSGADSNDRNPAVAYNSNANQYLVPWSDNRNPSARNWDIFSQRWAP